MVGVYGIHHLCINTPDIDMSIAFYRDNFGFILLGKETCDFGEYAMMKLNDSRLELIQPNKQDENTFGTKGSLAHFGLGVRNIDATVAELKAKGMKFLSEGINEEAAPMGGLRAISLIGPSGEAINLYEFKNEF